MGLSPQRVACEVWTQDQEQEQEGLKNEAHLECRWLLQLQWSPSVVAELFTAKAKFLVWHSQSKSKLSAPV